MNEIKVKKEELLKKLKQNRDNHRKMFLKAQEGYREMVIEELEKQLNNARKGKRFTTHIALHAPVDQTNDYDRAIKMMEMDIGKIVDLDETEFSNYVMDDWSWKQQFTTSNMAYFDRVANRK